MFSVVPGVDDSDVSSASESEKSVSERGDCSGDDDASASTCVSHLSDESQTNADAVEIETTQVECTESIPPSGISDQHWEKFQSLQKRRSETRWETDVTLSKNYKRRRRKRRRESGQKQGGDLHVDANQDYSRLNHKYYKKDEEDNKTEPDLQASTTAGSSNNSTINSVDVAPQSKEREEHWNTLKKYLNVNDHMKGLDQGKYAPKSGMEKKLDQAVAEGDFETAEEISDELATRDLACKIAKAANARDYLAWKHEQEERREANRKKRRKLAWGFEPKERWQMKGNM